MSNEKALVIIDAQRGFMPAEEGERLGVPGFGELTVPNGQNVVPPLNRLTVMFAARNLVVATTGDSHWEGTAHISEKPNFIDTWPEHCMEGTPGAELHPELIAGYMPLEHHFIKGDVVAATPEEDDSYTGFLAHYRQQRGLNIPLPNYLRNGHGVKTTYLGGVALGDGDQHPLCVDSTAIDFHNDGFEVVVITDAVEAVVPENRELCFHNLSKLGIRLATSDEVAAEVLQVQR
jgi:nicotinamidase/pyrazinamidase